MNLRLKKTDRFGHVLRPGDICVRAVDDQPQYIIYKGEAYGAKGISKGEYGRFLTGNHKTTVKYSSVAFVLDPMGKRKASSVEIKTLIKRFYEEK